MILKGNAGGRGGPVGGVENEYSVDEKLQNLFKKWTTGMLDEASDVDEWEAFLPWVGVFAAAVGEVAKECGLEPAFHRQWTRAVYELAPDEDDPRYPHVIERFERDVDEGSNDVFDGYVREERIWTEEVHCRTGFAADDEKQGGGGRYLSYEQESGFAEMLFFVLGSS